MKENNFMLKKASKYYPAGTIMDADYADDLGLLANRSGQGKYLMHSLEQAAGGTDVHVNAIKTD